MQYQAGDLEQLKQLADLLATHLPSPATVFLRGELGAGRQCLDEQCADPIKV